MAGMVRSKASFFPGLESLLTSVATTGRRNFRFRALQVVVLVPRRWMPRCTVLYSARGFPFPWERSRPLLTPYLARHISREASQDFPTRTHPLPAPTVAVWIIILFPW